MVKKYLLLNDCSHYHCGSKQVVLNIRKNFNIVEKNYDGIILNGEGTMHHDSKNAQHMLDILNNSNCETMLINSVWDTNTKKMTEKLINVDYISVRDIKSKNEILKHIKKDIDVDLDYCWYSECKILKQNYKYKILAGQRMRIPGVTTKRPSIKDVGEDGYVSIFEENWNSLLHKISSSKLFITGRHHEMYAACKTKTPFVLLEGNTHKNSGLLETAGVNIPCLPINASAQMIKQIINNIGDFKHEFEKLFDWMHTKDKPCILKNIYGRV